jgi:hypothetical protein
VRSKCSLIGKRKKNIQNQVYRQETKIQFSELHFLSENIVKISVSSAHQIEVRIGTWNTSTPLNKGYSTHRDLDSVAGVPRQ